MHGTGSISSNTNVGSDVLHSIGLTRQAAEILSGDLGLLTLDLHTVDVRC
jgi:hypothetical protein